MIQIDVIRRQEDREEEKWRGQRSFVLGAAYIEPFVRKVLFVFIKSFIYTAKPKTLIYFNCAIITYKLH